MFKIEVGAEVTISCKGYTKRVSLSEMQRDVDEFIEINLEEGSMSFPIMCCDLIEGITYGRIECLRELDDKNLLVGTDGLVRDSKNVYRACAVLYDNFVEGHKEYVD